jgi:thymidylate synthase ThyX
MPDYADAKHRPHAVHTGEAPDNPITYGPQSLQVTLDRWGPVDNLFTSMYDALQANWGEHPSRTVDRVPYDIISDTSRWEYRTGWLMLEDHERAYVESCFAGKTLQQVLEGITFDFCVDGVSRAFTHQNVRTRLGAGFMQHGGRDNDWRHRPWTMPETIRRACVEHDDATLDGWPASGVPWVATESSGPLKSPIEDWEPIDHYLSDFSPNIPLHYAIAGHVENSRQLYAALVDAGIPWQDARRVLPIGMQTYIHDQYNYVSLSGMLANRLEHVMDWEINCVAQLMLREIKMKCPPLLSKYLGSHSDKKKAAAFAALESWPPDRKYWSPFDDCATCGHAGSNHREYDGEVNADVPPGEAVCSVCEHDGGPIAPLHRFVPKDRLPRQHRPEQMPFFVLHPDSMAGGPVVWIPTNGQFPKEFK